MNGGELAKRAFDLAAALAALVVLSPLLALVAVYIKFCSPGPVFFAQQRVGRGGRPFRLWKFRTMHTRSALDADSSVTTRDDPRVFPGGRLLRRLKLDELPQLWNVVTGTMSLVGPRPTVAEDCRRMTPRQSSRCAVRPGITGLAQIRGGTALTWPERIELDLQYIQRRTFWLDLKILATTGWLVLAARADTHPPGEDEWSAAAYTTSPWVETMTASPPQIYLSPPHVGPRERQLLVDAFDSNWIAPLGPHVDAFEREFADKLGVRHAVALSSGTAALHLALVAAGVGPGDVVLTSTLTFVATANAIRYVGAEPVFIDSERLSWNLDPQLLDDELRDAAARGRLPKAAVVVDVCGQAADWDPILRLCRRYDVTAIEDAAEALGATYRDRPAGTLAEIGCFSFNGNKIITTSGGGMLVTENAACAERVRHLATQARDPALHYEHSQVGFNYRLSNLLAAVGRGQLAVLEDRVARRRANFEYYRRELDDIPGLEFMPEAAFGRASRWLTCLTIDQGLNGPQPADVCRALAARRIEARPMWKPMQMQPAYRACRVRGGPVAEDIFRRGLCLPSGSNLTPADRQRVVDAFRVAQGQETRHSPIAA